MTRYTTHGSKWTLQRELARDMRKGSTSAEDVLWQHLRGRTLSGMKFRRQHSVGRFILDFYCVEQGLAIEVDGSVHSAQREEDELRAEFLGGRGITLMRFTNDQVAADINALLQAIVTATTQAPQRSSPRRGEEVAEGRR